MYHTRVFKIAALFATLVALFLFYFNGLQGSFYYDDYKPLNQLAYVSDINSSLAFIFGETSGVLGRSVSMTSFLLNTNDWPNQPSGFLLINVIIHLINGALVALIAYLLLTITDSGKRNSTFYIALLCSFFWLVLPINTATNLIVIQRMASLSTLFILLGLAGYLAILKQQADAVSESLKSNIYLLLIVLFTTLLAMFSKENGILLPSFLLALELTILSKVANINKHQRARIGIGLLALSLVVIAILVQAYSAGLSPEGRTYTLIERAISQPLILIDYLNIAFIPINYQQINPFHDNYSVIGNKISDLMLLAPMLMMFGFLALAIKYRKTMPWFSFAIFWFLLAHLLESTLIPLEPYFLHRNYLALIGPCIAIAVSVAHYSGTYSKLIKGVFAAYLVALSFILLLTTQLWGQPFTAAEQWFVVQKGSERASGNLTEHLLKQGRLMDAWSAMEFQVNNCPNCIDTRVKAITLSCMARQEGKVAEHLQAAINIIDTTKIVHTPSTIEVAINVAANKDCQSLTLDDLLLLNQKLLEKDSLSEYFKRTIHESNAQIQLAQSNYDKALKSYYLAWHLIRSHLTAYKLVETYKKLNQIDNALRFVNNEMCAVTSSRPFSGNQAQERCDRLASQLEQLKEGK